MTFITLVDSTLREGNQAPGVKLTIKSTLAIGQALADAGIDFIEAGHPYASKQEFDRVTSLVKSRLAKNILAHSRAHRDDIDAVYATGANWIGIFAGINEASQKYRLRKTKEEIQELVRRSILYAKSLGLNVRYTIEDASRTDLAALIETYKIAETAGADRICYADSLGICEPFKVRSTVQLIKQALPNVDLEVHFHDDRGLAMANTLASIEAGATFVSCTVNGIGERCGITETCLLITNLHFNSILCSGKSQKVLKLSSLVSKAIGDTFDRRRPIIGEYSFVHTAKLHLTANSRDRNCYHWVDPLYLNE
ncbi:MULTISPECIES: LeuA family protein [Pseudomonas]|uniref:2-isopropylmalate synthase n=1 Tax=Pseudomonas salomonii TaxID=191391 RepID=A0A1H3U8Y1_9PSED|nr:MULTISPECIES: hypothetical protein [Pseudomonas]MCF5232702.1 homocitrate synthase [Pseudomonas sp. PA-5-4H]MCF5238298.1 homocitrate synthase [Pseudomonas sp. PA-5-4G]MCF5249517.1 homocitrate synthase [Pseudomonas sp. PA-5-4B]MCF5256130.1 homocitrate synthase [Pseudomonas sp. PA-5-4B]MCF5258792.1 homocitrate synthase [Pseudomonas sp. PA-5-4A]